MRIFYEVRFDGYQPNHGSLEAEVFYDDLYLGDSKS